MARYCEASCRLCRREGVKLFLKGARCTGEKCAIEKRNYAPGMHGQKRGKLSDYGIQLREKQKAKRIYGLIEVQFKNFFHKAERQKGVTGTNLLVLLERRLDNVVYRMGFASSRKQARQLVRHAGFLLNGRKINIPSYLVKTGDVIAVEEKSRELVCILDAIKNMREQAIPKWVEVSFDHKTGTITALPTREDIDLPVKEQQIVELYSK
ncbi:MAG: 30S ribosomal protein S4 [Candidatus Schekmanbacteria bacterium]|nr:30S ribosomal protein S4 [Candidatus Schekmanbacteria bacterium]